MAQLERNLRRAIACYGLNDTLIYSIDMKMHYKLYITQYLFFQIIICLFHLWYKKQKEKIHNLVKTNIPNVSLHQHFLAESV